MKLLFIHPSLESGGAEELRFTVLNHLAKKPDYDITICCIEKLGEIGQAIKAMGANIFCLNKTSAPYNIFATLALLKYLFRNRFDLVQTSLFNANFHGRIAAALAGVPLIVSEEHSEHYQYNSLKFLPYIWADRILSAFTDRIICCSKNLMDSIARLEGIPETKLFPLINVCNIDKLKFSRSPQEIKKKLGLSESDLIISNVASLCGRKGQDTLIKAFRLINDKIPSARLIFIGKESREFKQKLVGLVKQLGLENRVQFLGRQANIADYLNISDIFVLSSRLEGLPLAMLEAMYMQVAVIAPDIGGISEVIVNNQNGILVPANNIEALSRAAIDLLNNREKRSQLGQQAKKTVREHFNSERYLSQLEALYTRLLGNGKSPA